MREKYQLALTTEKLQMARIIDGRRIAAEVREDIRARAERFSSETGITPGLAVIIVGDDPASRVYVRNKHRACIEAGFRSDVYELPADTDEATLLAKIDELAADSGIHGILVQLPLPTHLDEKKVLAAIPPEKDVDAFHVVNTGHIMRGDYSFLPCTPAGIMKLLEYENIDVTGRECVVVGRSNIVGKPMAMLLLHANGTVTVCHSKTASLADVTRRADILVVAIGRAEFVTGDMVKPGAVVIDVGMNRRDDGKLCGDVQFDSVEPVASYITPVPGGVGPMTITMLLENTFTAAKIAAGK